jgi:hypothetical protein
MTVKIDGTNGVLQAYDYEVLTTGFSYTFAAGTQTLVINPAATLASGTITMPVAPDDGMVITFSSTKQITALTVAGNGKTVVGGPTILPAGQAITLVYSSTNSSWYPITYVPQLISSTGLATAVQPIGVGQTWASQTRSLGTTYTNTTGRPIFIGVSFNQGGANRNPNAYIYVDGVVVGACSATSYAFLYQLTAVVPNGSTYLVNNSAGSLSYWAELR